MVSKSVMTLARKLASSAVLVIAGCLLLCRVNGQKISCRHLALGQRSQDQSFYLGTPVTHPEWLSGIWEAPDGRGGIVGLHLTLDAAAPTDVTTLVGTRQCWLSLQAAIYRRASGAFQPVEMSGASDSQRGGGLRYANERLILHGPEFDMDLLHIAGNRWSGPVHWREFDSEVVLSRPGYGSKVKKAGFVGSWLSTNGPGQSCLHILQSDSGEFVAWSDSFSTWGRARFAPRIAKPPYSLEIYGTLDKAQSSEKDVIDVDLDAFTAICCSHSFVATAAENGTVMKATWPAGPSQARHRSEWKTMPNDTCIATPLQ